MALPKVNPAIGRGAARDPGPLRASAHPSAGRRSLLAAGAIVAALTLGLALLAASSSAVLPGTKCSDGELDAHTHAPADGDRLNGTGQINWSADGSLAGAESLSVTMELHRTSTGHQLTLMDNESKLLGTTSGSATFDTTSFPDAADYFAEVIIYAEVTGCSSREVTHDATGVPGEFVIDNDKPDDRPPANYTFVAPGIGDVRSGTVTIRWEGQEVDKGTVDLEHRPPGGSWTTIADATPDDGAYDWDTGPVADGEHGLRLTPTDAAGNVGETATLSGFRDGFDDGVIDADRWSAAGAQENGDCGTASGPSALKFDGSQDRQATTRALDVAGGGNVSFHLKIGDGDAPCDGAESGEGIELRYSTDDGATWTTLGTYAAGSYANFTPIVETIPADARTEATRFRWIQPSFTGADHDHWAIDDVELPDASGVVVDNSAPSLALADPTDGDVVGGNVSIAWDTSDDNPGVVEIERSTDGGASWSTIRDRTDDDGHHRWRTFGDARFSDWFDDASVDTSKWTVSGGGIGDDCGTAAGDGALTFDGSDTRSAATEALDVSEGGDVVFHLKIGSGSSPCENADSGEDVTLQYSLDGGSTWLDVATFDSEDHPTWTRIAQPIPLLAQSSSTRFRWIQDSHSGAAYDHWAIDEVAIDVDPDASLDGETVRLRLTPTDAAGNVGSAVTADVTVDNTPPTDYTISAPADGSLHGPSIDVNWSGTEANPGTVKLDVSTDGGDSWSEIVQATPDDGGYTWNASGIDDGATTRLRLTATDAAGNVGTEITDVGNRTALADAFDDGVLDTGNWTVAGGAEADDCGTASGAGAMTFNGSVDRYVTTDAIDVHSGGDVSFALRIGDGSSPCEDADSREGVHLEYSADGGSWQRIAYYDPDEHGSFTEIVETIPDGARSDATRFRWIQRSFSGAGFDNWAIDEVTLNASHHRPTARTGNFTVDNTAPAVTVDGPDGTVSGTTTISWSTTDLHPDTATIERTSDGGASWTTIVEGTADDGSYDWDTTGATDDVYELRVTATDAVGNAGANLSGEVTVDNAVPAPNLTAPAANATVGGSVDVTWELDHGDIVDVTLQHRPDATSDWSTVADGLEDAGSHAWDSTTVEEGDGHELRIVATDVGNDTGVDAVSPITIDNTAPSVTIDDGLSGVLADVSSIDWATSGDPTGVVDIAESTDGGETWSTIVDGTDDDGSYEWTPEEDGGYAVRVEAADAAGNVGSDVTSFTYDTTPPSAAITSPAAGTWVGRVANVTWETTDANPGTVDLELSADGGSNWTTIASGIDDDGRYRWETDDLEPGTDLRLRITPTDKAGHTGTANATDGFALDPDPPGVTLGEPREGAISGETTLAWTIDEVHLAGVELTYSGTRAGTIPVPTTRNGSVAWETTALPEGSYRIEVAAADVAGNLGTDGVDVVVDNTAPSLVLDSPSAGDTFEGAVPVRWTTEETNRGTVTIEFSVDDGSSWRTVAEATPDDGALTWEIPPADLPATLRLRVTATDAAGWTSAPATTGELTVEPPSSADVSLPIRHDTVRQVELRLFDPRPGVSVQVTDAPDPAASCGPAPPAAVTVYDSFDVEVRDRNLTLDGEEIERGSIVVSVPERAMEELDVRPEQALFLHCADGTWRPVDAELVSRHGGNATFAGTVSGFSPFVFGFRTGGAAARSGWVPIVVVAALASAAGLGTAAVVARRRR